MLKRIVISFTGIVLLCVAAMTFSIAQEEEETVWARNGVKVDGSSMQAFVVAYDAFRNNKDLQRGEKSLLNYSILVSSVKDSFQVRFIPKQSVRGKQFLGGRTALGRAIRYTVSKSTNRILKMEYFE